MNPEEDFISGRGKSKVKSVQDSAISENKNPYKKPFRNTWLAVNAMSLLLVFYTLLSIGTTFFFSVPDALLRPLGILIFASIPLFLIVLVIAGHPICESSDMTQGRLIYSYWFSLGLLIVPVIGTIISIIKIMALSQGRFPAYTMSNFGHASDPVHYPEIIVHKGESAPMARLFIATTVMGTVFWILAASQGFL